MKNISIIVPAYNAADTIERCLNSILRQTYQDIEIILVNDGSNDQTDQIVREKYSGLAQLKYVLQPNAGVSAARNRGLQESTGKYVMFVDSDDSIEPNMCELMLRSYKDGVDLVICGLNIYKAEKLLRTPNIGSKKYVLYDDINYYWELRKINLGPCNKLYKRALIQKKFDETLKFGEDTKFVIDYLRVCKVVLAIPNCLYNVFTDNANSLNRSYKGMKLHSLISVRNYELSYLAQMYPNIQDSRIYERFFLDLHVVLRAIVESSKKPHTDILEALNVIDYKELRKNVSFKNKYYKFFSYLAAHKHVDCLVLLLRIRIIIERIAIKA